MFSNLDRPKQLAKLSSIKFDLLVIGGGITGVGIALDAVSRGLKVALVEKQDFGAGTSSRSTKLIHGGLRYLKQLDFGLVREVGRERAIVQRNAPHLVWPEKMVLPIVDGGSLGGWTTSVALKMYEWLAEVPKSDQRKMLNREESIAEEPLLTRPELKGCAVYTEYRTDDARLVIEVAKTANSRGAVLLNYVELLQFQFAGDKISGATVKDGLSEKEYVVFADQVVNAAGPWVDAVRGLQGVVGGKRLHLTKGIHLVFDRERIPLNHSIYFDVGDGRMVFGVTRGSSTYIGTTDTDYSGKMERPEVLQSEVDYLLDAANKSLSVPELKKEDIRSSWVGLRPLIHEEGKSPSELSRKDEIFESDRGLISIAGGKLTGYRMMAKRTVDKVCSKTADKSFKDVASSTSEIKLTGSEYSSMDYLLSEIQSQGLNSEMATGLIMRYGSNVREIMQTLSQMEEGRQQEEALLLAELDYCINNEMVADLSDFVIRRTGRLYFQRSQTLEHLTLLNEYLGDKMGWDNAQRDHSLSTCQQEFEAVLTFK